MDSCFGTVAAAFHHPAAAGSYCCYLTILHLVDLLLPCCSAVVVLHSSVEALLRSLVVVLLPCCFVVAFLRSLVVVVLHSSVVVVVPLRSLLEASVLPYCYVAVVVLHSLVEAFVHNSAPWEVEGVQSHPCEVEEGHPWEDVGEEGLQPCFLFSSQSFCFYQSF